jgi:GNAT superfamily N-acetyltransferase
MDDPIGPSAFAIRAARPDDLDVIASMVRALAEFEKLAHLCVATKPDLETALFGPRPFAEVLIAWKGRIPWPLPCFSIISTFLGRPGLWLEDLFVLPEHRRQGCAGPARTLAALAVERGCGRFEWRSRLECLCDRLLPSAGRYCPSRLGIVRVVGLSLEALERGGLGT